MRTPLLSTNLAAFENVSLKHGSLPEARPGLLRRRAPQTPLWRRRCISTETATLLSKTPSILMIPSIFAGMTVALWTFKCASLVLFQNKIIYMPYLPPYSRRETLRDYEPECGVVTWRPATIQSAGGNKLALAIGELGGEIHQGQAGVVILYFQG